MKHEVNAKKRKEMRWNAVKREEMRNVMVTQSVGK
jgi:hypothetical protein